MADTNKDLQKLVRGLHELMRSWRDGWVPWNEVARHVFGSPDYVEYCQSLADLPDCRHLFAVTRRGAVKLTAEGIEFAQQLPSGAATRPEMVAAAVVRYARGLRPISLPIQGVSTLQKRNGKVVSALHVALSDQPLPSESPVEIRPENGYPIRGTIVGQEPGEGVLYVVCDTDVLPSQLPARLVINRAHLLTKLADQLVDQSDFAPRAAAIFEDLSADSIEPDINSAIIAARLCTLRPPWTRFLWGPPGAGKTYGLAEFVALLLKEDPKRSILIAAPSNQAADVAIRQVTNRLAVKSLEHFVEQRRILRYGYPRHPELLADPRLLGPANVDTLTQQVKTLARRIRDAERSRSSNADLALLRAELLTAQDGVKQAVQDHVAGCAVATTTTALAYLPHSPIAQRRWDTIIIDEVTMVSPAACAFLASQADARVLLAGDPCQLGPVYEDHPQCNAQSQFWLGTDVFEAARIVSGSRGLRQVQTADPRLVRISAQRRCARGIWEHIEALYPLVANEAKQDLLVNVAKLPPSPGESVVLLDTSESPSQCAREQRSWRNPYSARLALEVAASVAARALGHITVAIIAPYRAQVQLLREWIREECKAETTPLKRQGNAGEHFVVQAGTVHQFQGSEAHVVIFDLVDGRGRDHLGALLRGDTGARLVNVAISRAKGKLVVIADKRWCSEAEIHTYNPLLGRLILGDAPRHEMPVVPRDLAPTESPIEQRLLEAMLQTPELSRVKTQHNIRDAEGQVISRADFAFPESKYAVYCDGRQWHLREDRWEHDLQQRNKLASLGWRFSVFSGRQIERDLDDCVRQIRATLQASRSAAGIAAGPTT